MTRPTVFARKPTTPGWPEGELMIHSRNRHDTHGGRRHVYCRPDRGASTPIPPTHKRSEMD